MVGAALLATAILWLICAVLWNWALIIRPLWSNETQTIPKKTVWALQLSIVVFLFGVIFGAGGGSFLYALLPPTWLLMALLIASDVPGFVLGPTIAAFIVTLSFLALFVTKNLFPSFALILSCALGIAVFVGLGELKSQRLMCQAALAVGVSSFDRNPFFWSLGNTPREYQFEIHAYFESEGTHYGWSYSDEDFYVLNDRTWINVFSGDSFLCSA